jgi:hypothetical protein
MKIQKKINKTIYFQLKHKFEYYLTNNNILKAPREKGEDNLSSVG